MMRRRVLLGAALAFPVRAWAGPKLELIVGGRAGTGIDVAARAFAPFLERHMPQTRVRVVPVPGEAGAAALRTLAGSGEGSIGWVATPTLMARMVDRPALRPLLSGLKLVAGVQKEPIALVAAPGAGPDLLRRLVREVPLAVALPFATPPAGSPAHLAALRLQAVAGRKLDILPFPTAAAARQAAQAGNVALAALGMTDAIGALRAGQLAGVAVASRRREPAWAEIPTLAEAGFALSALIWRGLAVPAGASDAFVESLRAGMRAVVADPEFRDHAAATGFAASFFDGPAWNNQAQAEGLELAQLWQAGPWLAEGVG